EFLDKNDYKEADLDLFGRNSIFQYLNSCKTKRGRMYLADLLKSKHEYDNNQSQAVYELGNKEETLDIEASLLGINNNASKLDFEELLSITKNKIKMNILYFIPLLSFIGLFVYIALIFILNLNPFFLFIFLGTNFISTRLLSRINIFKIKASSYINLIDNYILVSKTFININYDNQLLNDYKNKISENITSLEKLKNVLDTLSYRSNLLFLILANSLFISDFFTVLLFNHRVKNNINIKEAFDIITKLEAMISLSNVRIDNEISCMPVKSDNFKFEGLYHPLIKNPVSNSLNIKEGIILTGSNMSGKTTFLRTIGIALILYKASGVVPAEYFEAPELDIYTSLRANDMLEEGVSTFYAEILRMKLINEAIKKGPCMILIDEIFKGTNMKDRLEASFKIIEKLVSSNQYFIISTHDIELTNVKNIINYHFSDYFKDDKIYFDYKIKEGVSTKTNALELLKMANII
ncbi:MAG: hypothetical protein IKN46_03750, partial [Acholeplasmatales bacterium]|nr:hypothetical protein [Acholeplasmatales bacterium]